MADNYNERIEPMEDSGRFSFGEKALFTVFGAAALYLGVHFGGVIPDRYSLIPKGYVEECATAVEGPKEEFTRICDGISNGYELESKNYFSKILQERDAALKAAGCEPGCEEWRCYNADSGKPDHEGLKIRAVFNELHTCAPNE